MENKMDKYLGQMLDNRYELLEVIGSGGMSVVYKAYCHLLNRYVAVKILRDDLALDSDFRRRFHTESQAVAMLSHPNIVSIYDVSRSNDPDYIVMELIDGITLKQYMQKKGALSWKEAAHFATLTARALSHAHSKGIIHRDIKPHNIMIPKDGTLKVADFGIARFQSNQNTLSQEALGSVHYISPEQARGEKVDARTDIYSLGIVMYEMLTGTLPYEGETPVAVALQHINGNARPPRELNPDIPAELERITMKAMNADPSVRYASADELIDDIEAFRKAESAAVITAQEKAIESYNQEQHIVKDVRPISTSGELSRDSYVRRRMRSKKVSMLTGVALCIVFIILIFVFLWNFWLKGLFSEAERITIPNFVGSSYEDVVNSWDFKSVFNFTVVYKLDPETPEGIIVAQNPESGASRQLDDDGIDVTLTVSSGEVTTSMPNVFNMDYRDAVAQLQQLGFVVEISTEESSSVTKDYVIRTIPSAGDSLPAGSTVYIIVSGGPEIVMVTVPDFTGLTEQTAIERIESLNLTVGTITRESSSAPAGTVVWQNVEAYTEVSEHTAIYLRISTGPAATENPEESPEVSDAPAVSDTPVVSDNPTPDTPTPEVPVVTDTPVTVEPVDPGVGGE